jgi:hypothetical protein
MSAIPFGIVGAVWGHVILGFTLTMYSVIGLIALSGVVVNASLVLVDYVNRELAEGRPIREAIRNATTARFRPILLTSLTTFFGLTPLMLETSIQARFMIPMAISLAFGVLFSSFITLLLVAGRPRGPRAPLAGARDPASLRAGPSRGAGRGVGSIRLEPPAQADRRGSIRRNCWIFSKKHLVLTKC